MANISLRNAVRHFGYRACVGYRPRNSDGSRGPYAWLTYDEVHRRVENFGAGLCNLGMMKVCCANALFLCYKKPFVYVLVHTGTVLGNIFREQNRVVYKWTGVYLLLYCVCPRSWSWYVTSCKVKNRLILRLVYPGDESLQFILSHSRLSTVVCSRVKTFKV